MNIVFLTWFFLMAIVGIVIFATRKAAIVTGQYSSKMKWLFGGYSVILLLACILFYLGPNVNSASENVEHASTDLADLSNQMIEDLKQGGKVQVDVPYVLDYQWEFVVFTDQIYYVLEGNYLNMDILVERVEELEGSIQLDYYQAGAKVNQLDITERHRPPHIELYGSTLTVMDPSRYNINLYGFIKEFTIRQFTGETTDLYDREQLEGVKVLHVKLPLDVEVLFEDFVSVEFIN